jgi:hypothetical protein
LFKHIDRTIFMSFCLSTISQVMLPKIFRKVNSQIRIRDISALMPSGQGENPPETPIFSILPSPLDSKNGKCHYDMPALPDSAATF